VYDETFSFFLFSLRWPYKFFLKSLLILSSLFARPLASRENKCAKELMFLVDELFILNGTYFFLFLVCGEKIEKCTFFRCNCSNMSVNTDDLVDYLSECFDGRWTWTSTRMIYGVKNAKNSRTRPVLIRICACCPHDGLLPPFLIFLCHVSFGLSFKIKEGTKVVVSE